MFFCVVILIKLPESIKDEDLKRFSEKFDCILAVIFTNLILHFFSIGTVKNGITIMRHAVYHPEEFDNPFMAIMLGVYIILV